MGVVCGVWCVVCCCGVLCAGGLCACWWVACGCLTPHPGPGGSDLLDILDSPKPKKVKRVPASPALLCAFFCNVVKSQDNTTHCASRPSVIQHPSTHPCHPPNSAAAAVPPLVTQHLQSYNYHPAENPPSNPHRTPPPRPPIFCRVRCLMPDASSFPFYSLFPLSRSP